MRQALVAKGRRASQVSASYSLPAPVGGKNKRDSIFSMPETDALEMLNVFPDRTENRIRKGIQEHSSNHGATVESLMPYNGSDGTQALFAAANSKIYDSTVASSVDSDRFYFASFAAEEIHQIDLSTAEDLATASQPFMSFSVRPQTNGAPVDVFVRPSGADVYVLANKGVVYQYSMPAAGNLLTASYNAKFFDYSKQVATAYALLINDDGDTMYIAGVGGVIFQYSLSTAWDISTATYDNVTFDASAQASTIKAMFFEQGGAGAGETLYVAADAAIYQYTLSTGWDISTASYASKTVSTTSQEGDVTGISLEPNGTDMYVVGLDNDTVYQYNLSVAGDVSTATYSGDSLSLASADGVVYGMSFDTTGTRMIFVGSANDKLYAFENPTWNLSSSTVKLTGLFADTSGQSAARGLAFKPDGTAMYVTGGNDVYQYTLSQAWNPGTATYASKTYASSEESTVGGIAFNPAGTIMYLSGDTTDTIYQYTLSTAWDVSTASYASKSAAGSTSTRGIYLKEDGTKLFYVAETAPERVYELSLSTPYDLATASAGNNVDISGQTTEPKGVAFSDDGTKMYVTDYAGSDMYQYTLGTPWDLSTASYAAKTYDGSGVGGNAWGLFLKPDYTEVAGLTNSRWQHVNFANSAGTSYLCCFNGADSPQYYDGSTWTAITGASTPAITGATTTDLVSAFAHKRRLYLIENNSLDVHYLPVDSVGGAVNSIKLGGIADRGGYVVAGQTWTLDAGAGMDDFWCAVTSEGQMVVYEGTDPTSSSTWSLRGVWNIGEPIGRRCMFKYQGDLLIITTGGVVSASAVLMSGEVEDRQKVSDKISREVSSDAALYKANFGWQMEFFPEQDMLILNVPITEGSTYKQHAMNTITGAWGEFDVTAACWARYDESMYAGSGDSVDLFWSGSDDDGEAIPFTLQWAYSVLRAKGNLKFVKAARVFVETDSQFTMKTAVNVDYSTDDIIGSISTEDFRAFEWDAVSGIGTSASLVTKGYSWGNELSVQAADLVYEVGGIIG